jgi:hypothetical protein
MIAEQSDFSLEFRMQLQPGSGRHRALQPSPSSVLPSSQVSSAIPSPHLLPRSSSGLSRQAPSQP